MGQVEHVVAGGSTPRRTTLGKRKKILPEETVSERIEITRPVHGTAGIAWPARAGSGPTAAEPPEGEIFKTELRSEPAGGGVNGRHHPEHQIGGLTPGNGREIHTEIAEMAEPPQTTMPSPRSASRFRRCVRSSVYVAPSATRARSSVTQTFKVPVVRGRQRIVWIQAWAPPSEPDRIARSPHPSFRSAPLKERWYICIMSGTRILW